MRPESEARALQRSACRGRVQRGEKPAETQRPGALGCDGAGWTVAAATVTRRRRRRPWLPVRSTCPPRPQDQHCVRWRPHAQGRIVAGSHANAVIYWAGEPDSPPALSPHKDYGRVPPLGPLIHYLPDGYFPWLITESGPGLLEI